MPKFNIGDKVKRIRDHGIGVKVGDILTVKSNDHMAIRVEENNNFYLEEYFVLVSSAEEEMAINLLKEKGYIITPPPEPLKGKVAIYKANKSGMTYSCSKESWDSAVKSSSEPHTLTLIAIVDWTEGQGL